jgi:hypothetical protein
MANQSVPYIVHVQDDLVDFLVLRDELIMVGFENGLDPLTIYKQTAHLEPFLKLLPDYKSIVPPNFMALINNAKVSLSGSISAASNPNGPQFVSKFGR